AEDVEEVRGEVAQGLPVGVDELAPAGVAELSPPERANGRPQRLVVALVSGWPRLAYQTRSCLAWRGIVRIASHASGKRSTVRGSENSVTRRSTSRSRDRRSRCSRLMPSLRRHRRFRGIAGKRWRACRNKS